MAFFQFPVTRRDARTARLPEADRANWAVIALAIMGMSYNAILAAANARGINVSFSAAAAVEIVLLTIGIAMALRNGLTSNEKNILYFFSVFIVTTLFICLFNQTIFVDGLRNMLLITVFTCLGRQINEKTIRTLFTLGSIIVLGFLILEMSSLSTYADLFKPALYFANSRGIAEFEYDETGLFKNTMGFEGRFSYGVFDGPRTSSLFLEQVSLANWAAVLCLVLLALWPRMNNKEKILQIFTIVLIVVSNNTRATSLLVLASLFGYYLYPRLPKYANAVVAPIFIVLGVIVYNLYPLAHEDDFVGRTSKTGKFLSAMAPKDYFGLGLDQLTHLWDSGYPWMVTATTVFGMIAVWLFITFIIPQNSPEQKRCAYGLTLYMFMNMLVSGNATFSIKVSAAMWLLVGFMSGTKLILPSARNALNRRDNRAPMFAKPVAYAQTLQQHLRAKR